MKSYDVEWYHHIPSHVKEILEKLQQSGRKAFVVGGAVRDLWIGKEPKDFDIVSEATPEEIEKLFPKTLDVGRSFGIMIVVTDAGPVEVARFRTDGAYTDGRHPDEIKFSNPEEDAKRRDFTINGLFYDLVSKQVIDYVGGVEDLKAKKIRAVGDPEKRFEEDSLRMLRALRFYAQLGDFTLDPALLSAIREKSSRLSLVSKERITQEIFRIFESKNTSMGLRAILNAGLWESIFHAFTPDPSTLDLFDELKKTYLKHFGEPDLALPFAAAVVWMENFSPESAFILERDTKAKINSALNLLPLVREEAKMNMAEKKEMLSSLGFQEAWVILSVTGHSQAQLEELLNWKRQKEKEGALNPEPFLKGADLLSLGMKPGPQIKKILDDIRRAQLNEEIASKEESLKLAHTLIGKN